MYIMLGLKRRDSDVTDEKFADSCYFLGFIFTIASIIFCLLDLPEIGTRIVDIAVRFGAAMVTTCAGLVVRVYLVSFKKDVSDAAKDVEDSVIQASQIFREQLVIACEKLRDFQSVVDTATKATIERVNMQVEKLSKDHADKLTGFFTVLTNRNQEAFTKALNVVTSVGLRLSHSVDVYCQGMQANLASIEAKVTAFGEAVTERLKTTTFPDDYFAKHLAPPLDQLKNAANAVSLSMLQVSEEVAESKIVLSGALRKFKTKVTATEDSLETVLRLTVQQQAVLDVSQGQLTTLKKLGETLVGFDALLNATVNGLNSTNTVTNELTDRVKAVVTEGAEARKQIELSLKEVVSKLGETLAATDALGVRIDKTAEASREVAAKLGVSASSAELVAAQLAISASATKEVADKLDSIVAADIETAKTLATVGEKATLAISKVDASVERLQLMVRQLIELTGPSNVPATPWWRRPFGP